MPSFLPSLAIIFALIGLSDGDPCGPQNIIINDCISTAYLYTPNIGSSYAANLTCTWTLTVPSACPTGMVAFFDWLSTDCSDSVQIFRGSHRLATWSGVSRSNNAFGSSSCQQLAPSKAIYLSNKFSQSSATALTIQLQSSSKESQFRQGFIVSFTAITLRSDAVGSNINDAFILAETSALISSSDELYNTPTSETNFVESFILPPTDLTYRISFIGNGQTDDSIAVACLPPPDADNEPQTSYPVRRYQGTENGSTTLCVRPVLAITRTLPSMNAGTRGIVANYFATNEGSSCSSDSTSMTCHSLPTTASPSKATPNFHLVTCLFTSLVAALIIIGHNLIRS